MFELIFSIGSHTWSWNTARQGVRSAGSGFPSLNVGAVGIGGTQYTPQFDHSSSALHASLHDAYLNAQKLNRSSSSKNLRKDIASDKKGSLEALKRLQ